VKVPGRRGRPSLFRSIATTLAVALFIFQSAIIAVTVYFVMVPMAKRSADDLAALMVLSAQTWAELPLKTRADFERELAKKHDLWLFTSANVLPEKGHYLPYLLFLEDALEKRTGYPVQIKVTRWEQPWYWVDIPVADKLIRIGFPKSHIGVRPPQALISVLSVTILLTLITSIILARRISRPLAELSAAAKRVGEGASPPNLPEVGVKELASLARAFNTMSRQVKELLDNRTTLMAGISHDLRTPLARMRLAVEMLPENTNPKIVARLQNDLEEMNRLIGEFLLLSRGLGKEEEQKTEIIHLLDRLVDDARSSGAAVEWHAQGPCERMTGPMALHRVLSNLIGNAIRYGEGKPVTVECQCDALATVIRVLDRGKGIPSDQMDLVFRPFHRLESSRNSATGGSGLGLAIAKQLADANGWLIALHPREGGGTEARLTIPV